MCHDFQPVLHLIRKDQAGHLEVFMELLDSLEEVLQHFVDSFEEL
jgi:hypothetical protein